MAFFGALAREYAFALIRKHVVQCPWPARRPHRHREHLQSPQIVNLRGICYPVVDPSRGRCILFRDEIGEDANDLPHVTCELKFRIGIKWDKASPLRSFLSRRIPKEWIASGGF